MLWVDSHLPSLVNCAKMALGAGAMLHGEKTLTTRPTFRGQAGGTPTVRESSRGCRQSYLGLVEVGGVGGGDTGSKKPSEALKQGPAWKFF